MIPILYTAGETAFTSNGLGRLSDVIKCTVKEALNGVYELEMIYPVSGIHYSDIAEHTIISAYTDDTHTRQPFEVYRISRPFNRRVTVNAWHISYRLRTMVARPFTATTCASAITSFSNSIMGNNNPFTFTTDKTTNGSMDVVVPTVARSLMGGIEGSFIDTYGGEWEYNGFTCSLKNRRGTDTGISIRYGKNLTDLKKITDTSNMFSGIVPYWSGRDADDQEIQVYYDGIIYAQDRSAFPYDKIIAVDASESFQTEPTQAQLETWGESYINSKGITEIQKSIDVSFVELWQTEEYKNVAALQRLFIGDSVHVYYNALGVDNTARIVSYEYDVIGERYNSMTLGSVKASLKSEVQADIDTAKASWGGNIDARLAALSAEIASTTVFLQGQIDQKIETWRQSADPSENWTSAERSNHIGDLWYYTGSTTSTRTQNATYRYNSSFAWEECEVSEELFDEIDGKSTIFYGAPSETYTGAEDGDYLVDNTDGSTYRRNNGQWVKVTDYNSVISSVESTLQTQIDAKIETYYQSTDPATNWSTSALKAQHVGDLWFYTGSTTSTRTENATYRYTVSGSTYSWTECEVSTEVFDEIDGKSTIFYGAPTDSYTGVSVNDYLVDPNTSLTYKWSGSQWVKVTDWSSDIATAISNATNLITGGLGGYVVINTDANDKPQEILVMDTASIATAVHVIRINKNGIGFSSNGYNGPFTNAWTIDGNLVADFITTGTMSANRIKGGTLSLGGAGNADGVILIYNAAGQEIGRWDKDGIKAVEGVHLAGTIYLGYETANKKVYGVIDYRSFLFTDTSGNDFFEVADMRDTSGNATITDSFTGDGTKKNFLPSLPISSMTSVKVNGSTTSAYTWAANVVTMTTAPANGATVVITYKTTSTNAKYYTFGIRKTNSTKGGLSVAEGKSGEASGFCSHVEGDNCVASSDATHANGYYTTAASPYQTVIGAYNLVDRAGRYAFIIGNGSSSGRSNALTVTWAGDIAASGAMTTGGDLTVGGTITSGIPMWKTVQKSVSVSAAAGAAISILANTDEGDLTKPAFDIGTQSGYTPVAAVKLTSGHNDLVIRAFNVEATGTGVMAAVRNVASAARTGTVTIEVLYLKNTYQA